MIGPVEKANVWRVYDKVAAEWNRQRVRFAGEQVYLNRLISELDGRLRVLDLGCGTGVPIARHFIDRGLDVTGVDAAPGMLAIFRKNFPTVVCIEHDMRTLALEQTFDAIVAWDSFFHLSHDDQPPMLAVFRKHSAPKGLLLFTSGPRRDEAMGDMHGHPLYHASLAPEEYRQHLDRQGFDVLIYRAEDPDCGGHTVWLAERRG